MLLLVQGLGLGGFRAQGCGGFGAHGFWAGGVFETVFGFRV